MAAIETLPQLAAAFSDLAEVVRCGLRAQPKSLPPRLFYDAAGSALFEQITTLPEYYLTRTEAEILRVYAPQMLQQAGEGLALIELGAGTAAKTGTLIRALLGRQLRVEFYPIDVSPAALEIARNSALAISSRVGVHPIVVDYTQNLRSVAHVQGRKLVLYLGSSIGNFEPEEAISLLRKMSAKSSILNPGDALLLGTDLAKSASLLVPAYDDSEGVTEQFNKNILARINRELGANFDLSAFGHVAVWNPRASRMEIYLESRKAQNVFIAALDLQVSFAAGERLHTENSYKYTPAMIHSILQAGGFRLEHTWTDSRKWFAVHLARV